MSLPPGYRFSPTDVELILYYLKRKLMGKKLPSEPIAEVDIYNYDPRDLPGKSCLQTRDLEWYFFCPHHIQNTPIGRRRNRATDNGFWKTTGIDRSICHNSRTVGMKKTLVFHNGRAPNAVRTNWVIHEYRLQDPLTDSRFSQDSYVVCKLFEKSGPGSKSGEQHGAPFIEEDWADDDVDTDNNSAVLIPTLSSSELEHDHDHHSSLQNPSFHPVDSGTAWDNQISLNSFQFALFAPQEPPHSLGIERSLLYIDSEVPIPILSPELRHDQSSLVNIATSENSLDALGTERSLFYIDSEVPIPILSPELRHDRSSLLNIATSENSLDTLGIERSLFYIDSEVPIPILSPELQHEQSSLLNVATSENSLDTLELEMLLCEDNINSTPSVDDCFTSNMDVENETAMQQILPESSSYVEMNDLQHPTGYFYSGLATPPVAIAASYAFGTSYDEHIINNVPDHFTTATGAASSLNDNNISEQGMTMAMGTTTRVPMLQTNVDYTQESFQDIAYLGNCLG